MTKPTVFLSYTHSPDQEDWVREFASSLGNQGVDVWLDTARIRPGESVPDAIDSGLRSSDAIVAVLGSSDLRRPSVLFELGAAFAMEKRIIPIVAHDIDPVRLPSAIRNRQFLRQEDPHEVASLVASALVGSPDTEGEAA